jgi:hypothetical protein
MTQQIRADAVPTQRRLLIALGAAVIGWTLAFLKLRAAGPYFIAGDFTWHWRAADALLRGFSPYQVINTMPVYPFSGGYPYLMPTAALAAPFGLVPARTAMPIFSGLSAGVLAYALMRDGYWRLPLLVSAPVLWSTLTGQLTPLITAAMLMPVLGWLAPIKFTMGAAGAAYNLSLRYCALAVGIVLLSIVIWPWWPREWWNELSDFPHRYYHVPIRVPGGILILGALARWRRPEARLLSLMACLPQTMLFYDQLPLVLTAQSYRQSLALALGSYVAVGIASVLYGHAPIERGLLFASIAPIITACYYGPCLIMVLLRPNQGPLPRWLERLSSRLPRWARGSTAY